MSDPHLPERRFRAGDPERDRALTVIQQAYEAGRLDLDELRDRQEQVLQVRFTDEIAPLLADLPEAHGLEVSPGSPVVPQPAYAPLPAVAEPDAGWSVSIMSGRDELVHSGITRLANFAWWGGNNYDLTEAMGPGRVVTLELHAVMGGNEIYVPDGVRVIDRAVAIMAGNDIKPDAQGDGSNGTLVLTGFLFWGGNTVRPASSRRHKR